VIPVIMLAFFVVETGLGQEGAAGRGRPGGAPAGEAWPGGAPPGGAGARAGEGTHCPGRRPAAPVTGLVPAVPPLVRERLLGRSSRSHGERGAG